MMSILPMLAAGILVGLVAGPLDAQSPGELDSVAVRLIEQLRDGNYAEVYGRFDSTMAQALPEEKLRQTWESLLDQAGSLEHLGSPETSRAGGYTIVVVPATFARMRLNARLAFDGEGRVGGLFFLPLAPPLTAPPYADSADYTERDVAIGSGTSALPATLTVPRGAGPFPAIVLVHGSGPNDRDETVGGVKVFRDLAWGLASRGIAVLRYEKRTRAHPLEFSGPFTVDLETVDDAVAGAELLRHTAGIDSGRVFVLGHSLGGMMAPRIGQKDPSLAGLVILAGTTRRLEDVLEEQLDYLDSLQGGAASAQTSQMREAVARVRALTPADSSSSAAILGAPPAYWLNLDAYHPVAVARTLTMPMLILQGERDYQVTGKDLANWRAGLGQNPRVTFKTYPSLNHLFVTGTGRSTPAEYAAPAHVAGEVVEDIAAWVKAH